MPFREPKFIGSRTTIQIVQFPVEDRKRFNLVYDNTTSEFRMYAVDAEAYPSVLIAGGGGGGSGSPGDDIQAVGITNQPGTHDSLYARDDHVHAGVTEQDILGGGDEEKPFDYHEFGLGLGIGYIGSSSTGAPSQRCMGISKLGYAIYLHFEGPIDGGELFFFVQNLTNQYVNGHEKYDTRRIPIFLDDGGTPVNDFCFVIEQGVNGAEMGHVVYVSDDGNVYDAYFLITDLITAIETPDEIVITAERVNRNDAGEEGGECYCVSASAQPYLQYGPGIVVTWIQAIDPATPKVRSNFYDSSVGAGVRYNVGLGSHYQELIVSIEVIGEIEMEAESQTVECCNEYCHCSYVCQPSGLIYYARMNRTGISTVPGYWDNIPFQAVNQYGDMIDFISGGSPSMVIFDGDVDESITTHQKFVGITMKDSNDELLKFFLFTTDFVDGIPTHYSESHRVEVANYMKGANNARDEYQLGISKITYKTGQEKPIFYIYNVRQITLAVEGLEYSNFELIYLQMHDEAALLGVDDDWNTVFLWTTTLSYYRFGPMVHYSYNWYNREWKTEASSGQLGKAYYPLNTYRKSLINATEGQGMLILAMPFQLLMKDIPKYTLGRL